ncbi:helix-turn-helix transcriptional regulator [Bradyrhizobium sp. CB82]|uniref:helix-turn-helix domain-containing protein n=1 Tax=Bradyrhizobium sp. CB82 TaxID=3039159 RepID=UPI0032C21900
MQQTLLAEHLAFATKGDALIVGPDFDPTTENQPAAAHSIPAAADQVVGVIVIHPADWFAQDRRPDQVRFRTMLLEKPLEHPVDISGKDHIQFTIPGAQTSPSADSLPHHVKYCYSEHRNLLPRVKDGICCYTEQLRANCVAESIRDRIKTLRKKAKLTLDQLADRAGLSKSYLWELENRELPRPSGEKLAGLARALDVTVDYLLGSENLESAEDKAFFREYQAMSPEARARLRKLAKALDE